MTGSQLAYLAAAAALAGIGLYGVLVAGHLLRKLLALNVTGMAVFLLLITLGGRATGTPDGLSQAMVLTGIVVAVSATGFALALLLALHRATGETTLDPATPVDGETGGEQRSGDEA